MHYATQGLIPASRTIHLHIGPHKTGSTYLQMAFHHSRELWISRNLLYPIAGTNPAKQYYGHHEIAREFADAGTGPHIERLLAETAGFEGDILLSSENFARLNGPQMTALRSTFHSFRLHICQLIRSRADTLYSLWAEEIKHGGLPSLPEYIAGALLHPDENPFINLTVLPQRFAPMADDYSILVYDNVLLEHRDLLNAFLDECLDLVPPTSELSAFPFDDQPNTRMDQLLLDVMRLLNFVHIRRGHPPSAEVRVRLLKRRSDAPSLRYRLEDLQARVGRSARRLDLSALNQLFERFDRVLRDQFAPHLRSSPRHGLFADIPQRDYVYFATEDLIVHLGGWDAVDQLYDEVFL